MVAPSDTIEFNNETRMLVSHSYPPVEYERVRMEAMYFPVSHTVHVYIFLDDVKPLPFRRGVRWLLHSPRIQDPKFELPMRGSGPNADVKALREMMDDVSTFTGIPVKQPEDVSWEQIELYMLEEVNAGKSLVEVRPVWDPNEKKSRR